MRWRRANCGRPGISPDVLTLISARCPAGVPTEGRTAHSRWLVPVPHPKH